MGGVVIVYFAGEFLARDGVAPMPEMHQVSDQVVLLVFRHAGQFFLNLIERHTPDTIRAGHPKSKRGTAPPRFLPHLRPSVVPFQLSAFQLFSF